MKAGSISRKKESKDPFVDEMSLVLLAGKHKNGRISENRGQAQRIWNAYQQSSKQKQSTTAPTHVVSSDWSRGVDG